MVVESNDSLATSLSPKYGRAVDLQQLWQHWKERPSSETLSVLLDASAPLLRRAIRTYAGSKDDPVVALEAKRLAVKAFETYDPSKGSLATHLRYQLAPLTAVVHERAQEFKVPKMLWADLQNLKTAEERLVQKLGRPPSTLELADETGLSLKRIEKIRQAVHLGVPESVLREKAPEEFAQPAREVESSWWFEAVYRSLDPIDQKILDWRIGAHGSEQLPVAEIAKRLHISPGAVSQRITRIVKRLQKGVK